ncbi:PRMT5-domain-containing protein [Pisolithus croceorrhizus]|nr:PRMT5-domain-containing protein [Pisolithus croceorrhizus]
MSPFATLATTITLEDIQNKATGVFEPHETAVLALSADCQSQGYQAICLPLTTSKWQERWKNMCIMPSIEDAGNEAVIAADKEAEAWRKSPSFLLDEVTITRLDEAEFVLAMASEWLRLDSDDDWVRHDSAIALRQEVAYASYLNVHTIILPPPRNRSQVASYARVINDCLKSVPYMQFSIRLPIYDPAVFQSKESSSPQSHGHHGWSGASSPPHAPTTPKLPISNSYSPGSLRSTKAPEGELNATWEMWDIIRNVCDYNMRLTLALDLTPPLPVNAGVLNRWAAEPVKHIFLPASAFIANVKGYPVLPKGTQAFLRQSMIHRPTFILSGVRSGLHAKGGEPAYAQYVKYLEKSSPSVQATRTQGTVENFGQGYQDYLQNPLQPLMDNLQSITYQTFEQDPVKYHNYEEAIYRALVDLQIATACDAICVAGAGRGPLVARSLEAVRRSNRQAFIYALEKNPTAWITLQERKAKDWGSSVELVFGDMRYVELPEKVDILVSELLGSFGDNELSPDETLTNGISIPSSYTAYLAPLSSSKLYNAARESKELKGVETPYVVMFQNVNLLSGDGGGVGGRCGPQIQECWEFVHPRRDVAVDDRGLPFTNSHNVRAARLCFHIPHAGVMHGFAGYFEAVLYGHVGLSIHPQRKDYISKDMLSWFPLFFATAGANSEVQVQVWYEWYAQSEDVLGPDGSFFASASTHVAVPSPLMMHFWCVVKIGQTALHNPGGRSSWIGIKADRR